MSKAGKKMIAGAKEALAVVRGDMDAISKIRVTPSCGCVFCDIGLKPHGDGIHRANGHEVACALIHGEQADVQAEEPK